jgi:hypothetical protein
MGSAPATLYRSFKRRIVKDGGEQWYLPQSAAHVLVSAPTETGKARRVLATAAVPWGGSEVVVSFDDLLQYVVQSR